MRSTGSEDLPESRIAYVIDDADASYPVVIDPVFSQAKKITAFRRHDRMTVFGDSVSISGDTVVVGPPAIMITAQASGAAYIFERDQGGAGNWGQVKRITALDAAANDNFGYRVSISGDTVVVGADYDNDNGTNSGSAYIFKRDQGGADQWGQMKKITALDAVRGDIFGDSVSISGDTVAVGADGDNGISGYHPAPPISLSVIRAVPATGGR